jgi:hypothetical protein
VRHKERKTKFLAPCTIFSWCEYGLS